MRVFVCWSGSVSRRVAQVLYIWLGDVLQNIRPFMSTESVRKGERWRSEVQTQLCEANFGIVCLTRSNLIAPWILFESGALTGHIREGRVTALLLGIDPAEIEAPLSQFQHTRVTRDDIYGLVKDLNALLPQQQQLSGERLGRTFDIYWPHLEKDISEALRTEEASQPSGPKRKVQEEPDSISFSLLPTELEVLQLLGDTPAGMYGLQLVNASEGKLRRGTVYITLGILEERGFLASTVRRDASHRALPRRIFRITTLGESVLDAREMLGRGMERA